MFGTTFVYERSNTTLKLFDMIPTMTNLLLAMTMVVQTIIVVNLNIEIGLQFQTVVVTIPDLESGATGIIQYPIKVSLFLLCKVLVVLQSAALNLFDLKD